jgi:hypothetical protein
MLLTKNGGHLIGVYAAAHKNVMIFPSAETLAGAGKEAARRTNTTL